MKRSNREEGIVTVYDPRAQQSALPIRKAAALVVYNEHGNVLIVRRSMIVDEYKNTWSLPSSFIAPADHDIQQTLQEKLLAWLDLPVSGIRLIGKRMGIRPKWRLLMHLYRAEAAGGAPTIQTEKYDAYQWVDGYAYFSQFRYERMGECTKSYLHYLHEMGIGDAPTASSGQKT